MPSWCENLQQAQIVGVVTKDSLGTMFFKVASSGGRVRRGQQEIKYVACENLILCDNVEWDWFKGQVCRSPVFNERALVGREIDHDGSRGHIVESRRTPDGDFVYTVQYDKSRKLGRLTEDSILQALLCAG